MYFFDKKKQKLKDGDIVFYSEMPETDYADSFCKIYDHDGVLKVGALLLKDHKNGVYKPAEIDPKRDMKLSEYCVVNSWAQGNRAVNLTLIKYFTEENFSLQVANALRPIKEKEHDRS